MEPKDRIIAALDVSSAYDAEILLQEIREHIGCAKVGLELLTAEGAPHVVQTMRAFGARVFYDGKFMDIPNTVAAAVRAVTKLGVDMLNVHCLGGPAMMKAAAEAAAREAEVLGIPRPKVLGVTILTSLNDGDLRAMGVEARVGPDDFSFKLAEQDQADVEIIVTRLARLAKECGLDGVITSPQEIAAIRQECGAGFLIVTPGVRPEWAATQDQKRVMTPGDAIRAGADYLVIGRPITKPPAEIGSPLDAVRNIVDEIAGALAHSSV